MQNVVLISNTQKKFQKNSHGKSYQQIIERKVDFFTLTFYCAQKFSAYKIFWVNFLAFFPNGLELCIEFAFYDTFNFAKKTFFPILHPIPVGQVSFCQKSQNRFTLPYSAQISPLLPCPASVVSFNCQTLSQANKLRIRNYRSSACGFLFASYSLCIFITVFVTKTSLLTDRRNTVQYTFCCVN